MPGAGEFLPLGDPGELHLQEIEIVRDRVQVAARLIYLAQREGVFVWHKHGMPEWGCSIVRARCRGLRDATPASAAFFAQGTMQPACGPGRPAPRLLKGKHPEKMVALVAFWLHGVLVDFVSHCISLIPDATISATRKAGEAAFLISKCWISFGSGRGI